MGGFAKVLPISLQPTLGRERHLLQVVGTQAFPGSSSRHRKCPESGSFLSVEPRVCAQEELISSYWLLFKWLPLIWDVFRSPSKVSKSRHPSRLRSHSSWSQA